MHILRHYYTGLNPQSVKYAISLYHHLQYKISTIEIQEEPAKLDDDTKQELSQQFLQAAATINMYPVTKEIFNFAILPEFSLANKLNVDEHLEPCLKRYLLIQQEFALSGNTLSPKELIIMNSVAQTFSATIAKDGPECTTAETEY